MTLLMVDRREDVARRRQGKLVDLSIDFKNLFCICLYRLLSSNQYTYRFDANLLFGYISTSSPILSCSL